jgi:hypothetical protein
MESQFLKGLGKKAETEAKPTGIMEKVAAGMEKLKGEQPPAEEDATKTAAAAPPKTEEGEVDHLASITQKVIGKEAAAAPEEPDALDSIAKKLGLGGEEAKTAEEGGETSSWKDKVNKAVAEAEK